MVFENQLERCWPAEKVLRAERAKKIQEFAKRHGWQATIHDPGIRVTFRKLPAPLSHAARPRTNRDVLVVSGDTR